jgi:hypothetical protein
MVDLDRQYQVVTMLWGLAVRLTDDEGATSFTGRYQPNSMRDGWPCRNVNAAGDAAGSATFQSVLEGVSWDEGSAKTSRSGPVAESAARRRRRRFRRPTAAPIFEA